MNTKPHIGFRIDSSLGMWRHGLWASMEAGKGLALNAQVGEFSHLRDNLMWELTGEMPA